MPLPVMALLMAILPLVGDPAIVTPAAIAQLLAQLSMLAMAIDYMRHEDLIESGNRGRRARDLPLRSAARREPPR